MTDLVTIVVLGGMVVLLAMGMPIFVALGVSGLVGVLMLEGTRGIGLLPMTIYSQLDSFVLLAIPLFVFMAQTLVVIGLSADLFAAAQRWLSRLPGGLAVSTVGACTVFAALSGSMAASTAGIGAVAVPEMIKRDYSPKLAAGSVCGAGGIATVIPPSLGFIVYGWLAGESVGKLFMAGIIPGILIAIAEIILIMVWVKLRPGVAPATSGYPWRERFTLAVKVWPVILIIIAVMGVIYIGIATPTEAGAIGSAAALLVGGLYYRRLNWQNFKTIVITSVRIAGVIGIIITGAMIYGHVLALLGVPQKLMLWVGSLPVSPMMVIIAITVLILILGCFFDVMGMQMIIIPLLVPVVRMLGFDAIWFGVLFVINLELAVVTPPFGVNLFILKGVIPDVRLGDIIRGTIPFVFIIIVVLALIMAFPILALWLPGTM